jgi:transcriptional regulator with PAS, ATPase and Fis domain
MSDLPNSPNGANYYVKTKNTSQAMTSLRDRVRLAAKQIESDIIMEALEQHRWNRRRTAEALRISYRSLMYKMKGCNLRDEPGSPQHCELKG